MAACKSFCPNESINSRVVGEAVGEGEGVADFAGDAIVVGVGDALGDGEGDWAIALALTTVAIVTAPRTRSIGRLLSFNRAQSNIAAAVPPLEMHLGNGMISTVAGFGDGRS